MDELLVTDVDYQIERGEPVIILRTADKDGQCNFLKKRGFKPYFYIMKEEYGELDKHGDDNDDVNVGGYDDDDDDDDDKTVYKSIDGQDVVKKYTKKPSDVSDLRDEYTRSWESDIRFPLRFLVDRGIKSGIKINDDKELEPTDIGVDEIKPTKLFLDIETTTTKETVNLDPDKNEVRIVSIAVRYINENKGTDKEFVFTDENEYNLLNDFIDCVIDHNPDMLLAWNSFFDMGTIFNNCKKLGVDIERMSPIRTVYKRGYGDNREIVCKGRKVIDLMYAYDRFYTNRNLETKALEPVCEDEVGIEQSHFDYDKLLEENWRKHIDEIVEYNKVDVERMVKLDKKLMIINHFEELRRTTGCMFKQAYRTSGFVDVLMLRAFKDKYVLPRSRKKKKGDDDGKKFKGGLVELMSEAGVYNWVAVLDFHAHYPTGIKNFNMSPETLVEDDYDDDMYELETELGFINFKQEPRGILPNIFDEMEKHRNELKAKRDKYDKGTDDWEYYNSRQYSRKQIINSIFGYFGYAGSRLYIPKLAAAVTRAGRKYIEDTIDYVENNFEVETHYSDSLDYNRKIIIKDDDGIDIVEIGKFVEECEYDCKKYKTLAMNTDDGKVKFEKIKQGISHKYDYNKKGKLLEFNTTRGKTVVTPQHSVYKLIDGKPTLVDAKDLEIGDELVSGKDLPNFKLYNSGDNIDLSKIDYEIVGAKIREIKEVEPTKNYVYDIEVENEHNFMDAEGNILVHNTDSIFFSVDADNKEKAVKRAKDIEKGINTFWEKVSQENNLYGRPDIECEKIYESIFFKGGTKKRYAGLKRWVEGGKWVDEISVSGFEIVRTDESKPTKDAQQGLFEIILRENDFQKMHEHLTDVIYKLKNAKTPKDMAKPSPIRMKPKEYERPYAVHGVIWSNKNIDKEFGITESKPYIVHIKSLPEGYDDVLYIPKIKGGKDIRRHIERIALSADDSLKMWKKHIDYDTHIEKLVKDKVQPILEAIGYSYSEVVNNQKQSSMDKWL